MSEGDATRSFRVGLVGCGRISKTHFAALKNVEPPIELDGDARTLAKVLKL